MCVEVIKLLAGRDSSVDRLNPGVCLGRFKGRSLLFLLRGRLDDAGLSLDSLPLARFFLVESRVGDVVDAIIIKEPVAATTSSDKLHLPCSGPSEERPPFDTEHPTCLGRFDIKFRMDVCMAHVLNSSVLVAVSAAGFSFYANREVHVYKFKPGVLERPSGRILCCRRRERERANNKIKMMPN